MKILLFIPVIALALFANSCRTALPIDPMTMKPSERCLPENLTPGPADGEVHGTK